MTDSFRSHHSCSAFNKTRLPPELRRVLSCKSPAVFLHFLLEKKGPWGPFYQLRRVLAKGRHLLQILLKALCMLLKLIACVNYIVQSCRYEMTLHVIYISSRTESCIRQINKIAFPVCNIHILMSRFCLLMFVLHLIISN